MSVDKRRMTQQLTIHEGVRLFPYLDTVGVLTIGVGRNLDDKGISESEANFLCQNDIEDATADLVRNIPCFNSLSTTRQMVLIDMCFNLGINRLLMFQRFLLSLTIKDYETAAREMLDSLWADQVGMRSLTLADMMRENEPRW